MTRYWVIAPYDSTQKKVFETVWDYDKKNGSIAVGWNELGNIFNSHIGHEEYVNKYNQIAPTSSSYDRESFWRFYNDILVDDTIIARRGRKEILGIGTVVKKAYYDPQKGSDRVGNPASGIIIYSNFIDVRWEEKSIKFPSIVFPIFTIWEISQDTFDELKEGIVPSKSKFTWVAFYEELAEKLLDYKSRQPELIQQLKEMEKQGLPVIHLKDIDVGGNEIDLQEIDPFTFFANFNRGITNENRQAILKYLKSKMDIKADIPDDFDGIPVMQNLKSWFFSFKNARHPEDVTRLWLLMESALKDAFLSKEFFHEGLNIKQVAMPKITVGLFWVQPEKFLPMDGLTQDYLKTKGLQLQSSDYDGYMGFLDNVKTQTGKNFKQISYDAYRFAVQKHKLPPPEPPPPKKRNEVPETYSLEDALDELFIREDYFKNILRALESKKNVILQGPPGTGKTYVGRRLAYVALGKKDKSQIEMIQFHQSYSYEDFIQGYRPNKDGGFALKTGVFYEFVKRAQKDLNEKYIFIIDEINRANLSKVFGEIMMLIEPDKRGESFAIPLIYSENSDERFYIPENVYLIGTMNTADRSITIVDYALRRRFLFFTLKPEFGDKFRLYLKSMNFPSSTIEDIIVRISKLNEVISKDDKNLGPGFEIGHSFFCPLEPPKDPIEWYNRVIDLEIRPLLNEYWFDDPEKAQTQANLLSL